MRTIQFLACVISSILLFQPETVYSQNKDLKLWYKQPAAIWDEALPVGNGRLGAMVFGDCLRDQIQLNEESLWAGTKIESNADAHAQLPLIQQKLLSGEVKEAMELSNKYLRSSPLRIRSYQSLGDIFIDFYKDKRNLPKVENYRRELDLETGIATTSYTINGTTFTREVFASAPDNVIVIRLSTDKPGRLTFRLSQTREQDASVLPVANDELLMNGQIVDMPEKDAGPAGLHMKFASRILGVNKGGSLQAVNNSFFVENADEVTFYLTAATDYNLSMLNYDRTIDPAKVCSSILLPLRSKTFESVRSAHIADHSAMFNRLSFRLGKESNQNIPTDERLKALKAGGTDLGLAVLQFQYGRYLLMGSSRAPGILPANLQGIWNKEMNAPWNADFHTNINIQMNYWPAEVCNLSETVIPFSNLINKLREPGRITAAKTYNSKGWTMNHLTDVFGWTAIADGVGWGTYPIAASWLVLHQWEHFLFTGDKKYLETEAYPCMKEAAEFMLGFLVKDKNGNWVTAPSNSPENTYKLPNGEKYMLTYGSTMDIQIVRELFQACIAAGNITGEDKKFRAELQSVLKNLPATRVSNRYGIVQEWIEDYEETEPGHRHMSQLFGLHPGTQITAEKPELFAAAKRTIERRQANSLNGKGSTTGWSKAWMINFLARLNDGDAAWNKILELQRDKTLNNLFDTHPPFQIDGNFGLTAGIAEMLIQSHAGYIEFLPALPKAWSEGSITGLKARGNVEAGIQWENNRIIKVELKSAEDKAVVMKYGALKVKVQLKKDQVLALDGNLKVCK